MHESAAYLPKQDPEREEVHSAIDSTFALASVGIAAVKTMESVLPSAASDVEKAGRSLASKFMLLSENVGEQCDLVQKMLTLLATYGVEFEQWDELNTQANKIARNVHGTVSGMVVDMQFQDRNTQMMENAAGILQHYGKMLEQVRDNIEEQRHPLGEATGAHISEVVETILSCIRVEEIRSQFMHSLARAKVLHRSADTPSGTDGDTDIIELF